MYDEIRQIEEITNNLEEAMQHKDINDLIESLRLDEIIEPHSIPNLDLYMDQVITLFEEKLGYTKRSEEDKLLTKTMINNYAKDRLLMPAKKKKYTREHIILMILLYELKQILTISDIKLLFSTIVKEEQVDAQKLEEIYQIYLQLKKEGINDFKAQVEKVAVQLEEKLSKAQFIFNEEIEKEGALEQKEEGKKEAQIEDMLLAIMLTQKANYYKRMAEKIIDQKIIEPKMR